MARKRVPRDQKARGEWVELLFMANAARRGLKVSKPHGTARYDVVVEPARSVFRTKDTKAVRRALYRVQVKSTMFMRRGCYECLCFWSRVGGTRRPKRYMARDIDFVAAYVVPDNAWFIVPVEDIRGTSLYLPPKGRTPSKYAKYREAWDLLGADDSKGLTIEASAEVWCEVEELARRRMLTWRKGR